MSQNGYGCGGGGVCVCGEGGASLPLPYRLGGLQHQRADHNKPSTSTQSFCEGSGDVVGVVTPLVGGVAQAFHDDRVVELRVQLGVEEVDGERQEGKVEVESEKRVKEGAPWMVWRWL